MFHFQVQFNLAKDVLRKVEANYQVHNEYEENLNKSRIWIDRAKEVISLATNASSQATNRDVLESRLRQIQVYI